MAQKIKIRPGQSVGLHLTPDEREAVLCISRLDDTLRRIVEQASAGDQNVMFGLDELDVLAKDISAEIGKTKDRRLQKKLYRMVERIERLAQTFEECP